MMYACFCEHVCRAPLGENPVDATDLRVSLNVYHVQIVRVADAVVQ